MAAKKNLDGISLLQDAQMPRFRPKTTAGWPLKSGKLFTV